MRTWSLRQSRARRQSSLEHGTYPPLARWLVWYQAPGFGRVLHDDVDTGAAHNRGSLPPTSQHLWQCPPGTSCQPGCKAVVALEQGCNSSGTTSTEYQHERISPQPVWLKVPDSGQTLAPANAPNYCSARVRPRGTSDGIERDGCTTPSPGADPHRGGCARSEGPFGRLEEVLMGTLTDNVRTLFGRNANFGVLSTGEPDGWPRSTMSGST